MNREQKAASVENMHATFNEAPHMILASFRGLTVNQATELRHKVREAGGRYRVVKNRLAKRAAAGTPMEPLTDSFSGPCAVASHADDPVSLAKALHDFAKENPQLELLAGVVDAGDVLDHDGVKALSALPGLNELRATLLALLTTPATNLVRLLNTPATRVARVLNARSEDQAGGGSEATGD